MLAFLVVSCLTPDYAPPIVFKKRLSEHESALAVTNNLMRTTRMIHTVGDRIYLVDNDWCAAPSDIRRDGFGIWLVQEKLDKGWIRLKGKP